MLDQEDDPELDDEWLTADEHLTCFSKAREKIVGRVKGSYSSSVQGPQSSEEDLVVRERVTSSTERPSVILLSLMGTMRPLVNHIMTFLVIAKKYRSRWTMCVLGVLKTNIL